MPQSLNRRIERGIVGLAAVCLALVACTDHEASANKSAPPQVLDQHTVPTPLDERKAVCESSRASMRVRYDKLRAERRFWDAARVFEDCASALPDASIAKLIYEAEAASFQLLALDPKAPLADRVRAIHTLENQFPDTLGALGAMLPSLQAKLDKQEQTARAKSIAEVAANRRKQGISIGMTVEEVRQSSWGRPQSINRTITGHGVHEQWVYGRNYLYFDDGILTAVQN